MPAVADRDPSESEDERAGRRRGSRRLLVVWLGGLVLLVVVAVILVLALAGGDKSNMPTDRQPDPTVTSSVSPAPASS